MNGSNNGSPGTSCIIAGTSRFVFRCVNGKGINLHDGNQALTGGFEGRISTLLGRLRGFICNRSYTSSPMSSGCIFQASFSDGWLLLKWEATEPGMIVVTLTSC